MPVCRRQFQFRLAGQIGLFSFLSDEAGKLILVTDIHPVLFSRPLHLPVVAKLSVVLFQDGSCRIQSFAGNIRISLRPRFYRRLAFPPGRDILPQPCSQFRG